MAYNTGLWGSTRTGIGAFYFDALEVKGMIGAFYLGNTTLVPVSTSEITFSANDVTSGISSDVSILIKPSELFFTVGTYVIEGFQDVYIEIYANKYLGYSPLTITFSADIKLSGNIRKNYVITEYDWYFDYENDMSNSAVSYSNTITHIYSGGIYGRQYDVALNLVLEPI